MMSARFPYSLVRTLLLLLACLAEGLSAADYPSIPAWSPDPAQREHLRRSLTLLETSTPERRNRVRVLFYGQSITQQAWWRAVETYLRSTYPHALIECQNRAIGGHSSQLLVKTAEADLYPFQPDLVIFHVYGSHFDYERIIRGIRERTCADILLQTDHITKDEALNEATDPSKLSPKEWDAWMNNSFLPGTAAKYQACRADIHTLWKKYLRTNGLKASDLLKDAVHLNAHGEWLMAELVKGYLSPLETKTGYDPQNEPRVKTYALPEPEGQGPIEQTFEGTRVDFLWMPAAEGQLAAKIDHKAPSAFPGAVVFTRVSAFPNSDWPLLLQVGHEADPQPGEWSMKVTQVSSNGAVCHFTVSHSVFGEDGEGWSTNRFVSKSGQVVIEPADWNLAFCISVFKRALPEGHVARWRAELLAPEIAAAPGPAPSGAERVSMAAYGLPSGSHVLQLPPEARRLLRGVRVYRPARAE